MGQSRRGDPSIDVRIIETVARGREPETLGERELQLDVEALTKPPVARPVKAWVRYEAIAIEVDAEAVAWTSRAVAIRWRAGDKVHRAWVWASAVSSQQ